jgi:aspartyl-tRNA(Asn)/glutamyl-tRNA(Gln) amidotransferase subunit C
VEKAELSTTAELASLELSAEDGEKLGNAVTQMLEYFLKMAELDVDRLEPTTHSLLTKNRLRRDETISNEATPNELLELAPERETRFIVIPNVL